MEGIIKVKKKADGLWLYLREGGRTVINEMRKEELGVGVWVWV